MDETTVPAESGETLSNPQEIKFGAVIHCRGDAPNELFVVVHTYSATRMERAFIKNDSDGNEQIGLPGTNNERIEEVVGFWPTDKMRRAFIDLYGYKEDTAPQDVLDKTDHLIAEYSAIPPVTYTGSDNSLLDKLGKTSPDN